MNGVFEGNYMYPAEIGVLGRRCKECSAPYGIQNRQYRLRYLARTPQARLNESMCRAPIISHVP